ncbi:MAG TPA: YicC/YloC family endoribonuclease [Gemmatimonadaceae bacterium]|nr:YicC/YloC family endoribonuclease [Gemmatimonadaceae bacterium]
MIQSMTGFGSAEGPLGRGRVTVEVRAVNHRFFNPSLKLPSRLQRWETEVRELLRRRVARGHVTLTARIEDAPTAGVMVDEARAAAYVSSLRDLSDRLGLEGGVDLATLLRLPDVLRPVSEDDAAPAEDGPTELMDVVARAADELIVMRRAEGERLAAELRERLAVMEGAMERVAARAPERLVEHRDRLRASVRELTEGLAVDEQRLAQEIALLADRLDVQEEVARFAGHLAAFREALDVDGGEPVGKRLGFLLQEMLREVNTTGSKANDAAMLREVLLLKEELERVREQVENVE